MKTIKDNSNDIYCENYKSKQLKINKPLIETFQLNKNVDCVRNSNENMTFGAILKVLTDFKTDFIKLLYYYLLIIKT